MDWLTIIKALLPLVPANAATGATGEALVFAEIVAKLIAAIKSQKNMTTDQILQRAGVTLDETKKMLLEDLEKGE